MSGCLRTGPTCGGVISLESTCSPQCEAKNLWCDKDRPKKELDLCQRTGVSFLKKLVAYTGNLTDSKIVTDCEEDQQTLDEQCFTYFVCNICHTFCGPDALWRTCQRKVSQEEVVTFWIKQKNDGRCNKPLGCEAGKISCYPKKEWDRCLQQWNSTSSSTTPRLSPRSLEQTTNSVLTQSPNDDITTIRPTQTLGLTTQSSTQSSGATSNTQAPTITLPNPAFTREARPTRIHSAKLPSFPVPTIIHAPVLETTTPRTRPTNTRIRPIRPNTVTTGIPTSPASAGIPLGTLSDTTDQPAASVVGVSTSTQVPLLETTTAATFPAVVVIGSSAGALVVLVVIIMACLCAHFRRMRKQRENHTSKCGEPHTMDEPVYYSVDPEDYSPFPDALNNPAYMLAEPPVSMTATDIIDPNLETIYSEISPPDPVKPNCLQCHSVLPTQAQADQPIFSVTGSLNGRHAYDGLTSQFASPPRSYQRYDHIESVSEAEAGRITRLQT